MPDSVTVRSRTGFFSRLADSIKSVVFGVAMFVAAFPVLFWNEGRAVRTARSLEEGSGAVVSVASDPVDPANEGRLVHVNGFARTEDVLRDETFGVSENAVKLTRAVEMYQWVESSSEKSETKIGGGQETTTTYDYSKEWRSDLVDSARFQSPEGHRNPAALPFEEKTETAGTVTLGVFTLSSSQVEMLDYRERLEIGEIPAALAGKARLHDGAVYVGADPASPVAGDVRIRFDVVRPGAVSVVARQLGSTFEPYRAEGGGAVFLLEESIVSAAAMFESAETSNAVTSWILRGVGFLIMFVGLSLVFRPIAVVGDVVPVLGKLLGAGVGVFSGLVAAFFSFFTIGLAWFVYRPLLGMTLLVLAVGAGLLLARWAARAAASPRVPGPPPLPSR